LIEKKANIKSKNFDQQVPLHTAAKYGHADCAEILIESGSDVNVQDVNEWTPLHFAAELGDIRAQFHQRSTFSFYAHGAQKHKKQSSHQSFLHFWDLRAQKLLVDQGSISTTFFEQLFMHADPKSA